MVGSIELVRVYVRIRVRVRASVADELTVTLILTLPNQLATFQACYVLHYIALQ